MVNISNTKSCPYISPPMYKPTQKCLRTNISPGIIFGGLRYRNKMNAQHDTNIVNIKLIQDPPSIIYGIIN